MSRALALHPCGCGESSRDVDVVKQRCCLQPDLPVSSREILSANLHSSALTAGPADKEESTGDKSSICRFTNTLVLLLFPRQLRGGEKHRLFSESSPPSLFCVCIWKASCSRVCCFLLLNPELCLWDPACSARMGSILFQSPFLPGSSGWKSLVPSLLALPGVPKDGTEVCKLQSWGHRRQ